MVGKTNCVASAKPKVKPFGECTDEELIDIVNAYYNNVLTIEEIRKVWKVGDERDIRMPYVEKSYSSISTTASALDDKLIILDFEKDTIHQKRFKTDKKKALVTVQHKFGLFDNYANSSFISYQDVYATCELRKYLFSNYVASLPQTYKSLLKPVVRLRMFRGTGYSEFENAFLVSLEDIYGYSFLSLDMWGNTSIDGARYQQYAYFKDVKNVRRLDRDGSEMFFWTSTNNSKANSGEYNMVMPSQTAVGGVYRYNTETKVRVIPTFCM